MEALRDLLKRFNRIGYRGELVFELVLFVFGLILILIGDVFGWLLVVGSAVAAVLSFRSRSDRED